MARNSRRNFGIAIVVLIVLALIAHFAGGGISEFFGKLHGR
jgi:hypothetical protein